MEIAVFDCYVRKKDGNIMHFDVMLPKDQSHEQAIAYGAEYLRKTGRTEQPFTANECQFCHVDVAPPHIQGEIQKVGYYIYEMEGCK